MLDFVTGLVTAATAPVVRVQRIGNSKVLPLPAELAHQIHADVGQVYNVEIAGDDIIYHRRSTGTFKTCEHVPHLATAAG